MGLTYYVQWQPERPLDDAVFLIILGPWDRDVPAERVAAYRALVNAPKPWWRRLLFIGNT